MDKHLFIFSKEEERIRSLVLRFSIITETLLSQTLECLLNIKGNSKSFGKTGAALSFSQKANILIDTNFLNPEDAKKFQTFMEIRNQFIHNVDAKSFVDCLSFIKGKKEYLYRVYPHITNVNTENRLELIWIDLCGDIMNVISNIITDFQANKHVHIYVGPQIQKQ